MKLNPVFSHVLTVAGGGPQGGTAGGILEYLSQTANNLNFLDEDEGFKFIDDASMVEILNLLARILSKFNAKMQVPSDIATNEYFISNENLKTQQYLNEISSWTDRNEMKLNCNKTKYMVINFCKSSLFQTRLYLNNSLLEEVKETRLLGALISEDLRWNANTESIIKKANKRMTILRNVSNFNVPKKDLIHIYILFIRSVLEQSCVVWGSAITESEVKSLERVQKCALHIIFQEKYDSYLNALKMSKLPTLAERRAILSLKFALKCTKNDRTKSMFPLNVNQGPKNTRNPEKYTVPFAYHQRLKNSAIPAMARQLNEHHRNKAMK